MMAMEKGNMMHAWKVLLLGLLILANTYWMLVTWDYFIGIVLVLTGLLKMIMPKYMHCRMM